MTHPHFVPPNSVPAPPGPPAFVTPPNVAPVVPVTEQDTDIDTDTDAPQGALVESTSEMPLVSNPYAAPSTSDDEPVAEAEAIVVEAAAEAPAETDAAQAIEEAQAELEEAATQIEEAKADLDEADAELGQATAELEEAEEELAVVEEVVEDTVTEAPAAEAAPEEAVAEEVYEEDDEYSDDFSDEDDDAAGQLRPGDVEETVIAIWDPEVAERYRDAWRDIQAHFVDEPEAALGEAQDLVAEAVQALADALLAEQVSLDPHEQDATPDTEAMRIAMRGYRDFLERVLAL